MNENQKSSCTGEASQCERALKLAGRLSSYAAAASLGAFSGTDEMSAAIVYTDVPDVTITQGQGPIYLNLDGVGQNEFAVAAFNSSIRVNPYNVGGQQSKVLTSGSYYVNSFLAGVSIGPGAAEASGARFGGRQVGGDFYNFVGTGKFVGLKWDIGGGDFQYGWARIDVLPDNAGTATLFSFAYESTPNTAIAAGAVPEPATLSILAAGGGAVALRRRRRNS